MSGFNESFFPGVDAATLAQPIGAGDPASSALGSIFGTASSFLNPVGALAGIIGPALGGAPSSAQGQADSGAPVTFGPIQIGDGNNSAPTTSNVDNQTSTQVPVQPTVGVTPSYQVPRSGGVADGSNPPSSPFNPLVMGALGLAGVGALLLLR